MNKKTNFRKLVKQVLGKYGFSSRRFSKLSGIPARTIQHLMHGDHKSFSLDNQRKFYSALERLERIEDLNRDEDSVIDFTKAKLPICIKIGNLVATFEEIEVKYDA